MLIFLLLAAVLKSSSSAPLSSTTNLHDPSTPIIILGRELPGCGNPPRHRTLQDIIWSCLVTIFACTWVALHPNVSKPCTSGWGKFKHRITTMLCALLIPELITAWALNQRIGAAKHMAEYNWKFHSGEKPQDESFLQVIRSIPQYILDWFRSIPPFITSWFGRYDSECHEHNRNGPWTLTHGFLLEMDGLRASGQIFPFREVGELPRRLSISEAEVKDKSKGDFLTKLIVVLQTTWFIFQVFTRWISHLPVTELEVITLGFAFLNIITYVLWWNKPQNMEVAIYIDTRGGDGPEGDHHQVSTKEDMGISGIWKKIFSLPWEILKFVVMVPFKFADMVNSDDESLFYSSIQSYASVDATVFTTIIGVIFGGLHFIPLWTSSFPSTPERILWMVSVGWITVGPVLLLVAVFFSRRRFSVFLRVEDVMVTLLMIISSWLYVTARVVVIILSFTTLRGLQLGAYRNIDWTAFIPHF